MAILGVYISIVLDAQLRGSENSQHKGPDRSEALRRAKTQSPPNWAAKSPWRWSAYQLVDWRQVSFRGSPSLQCLLSRPADARLLVVRLPPGLGLNCLMRPQGNN